MSKPVVGGERVTAFERISTTIGIAARAADSGRIDDIAAKMDSDGGVTFHWEMQSDDPVLSHDQRRQIRDLGESCGDRWSAAMHATGSRFIYDAAASVYGGVFIGPPAAIPILVGIIKEAVAAVENVYKDDEVRCPRCGEKTYGEQPYGCRDPLCAGGESLAE